MNTTAMPLPFALLSREQIQENVYLGDNEKNIELLNAFINGGDEINMHLPNFTTRLAACSLPIANILHSTTHNLFILENSVRAGFPFLCLTGVGDKEVINIGNKMNWSDTNVGLIEASMMLTTFCCSYLCESTENEQEQEFCTFLTDYYKELANTHRKLDKKIFNSSDFFSVIN